MAFSYKKKLYLANLIIIFFKYFFILKLLRFSVVFYSVNLIQLFWCLASCKARYLSKKVIIGKGMGLFIFYLALPTNLIIYLKILIHLAQFFFLDFSARKTQILYAHIYSIKQQTKSSSSLPFAFSCGTQSTIFLLSLPPLV